MSATGNLEDRTMGVWVLRPREENAGFRSPLFVRFVRSARVGHGSQGGCTFRRTRASAVETTVEYMRLCMGIGKDVISGKGSFSI